MKKTYTVLVLLVLIVGVGIAIQRYSSSLDTQKQVQNQNSSEDTVSVPRDYKNTTYIINNRPVTLVNGFAEVEAAPGSVSKITTRYFGNEIIHDLNDDGRQDIVFLITQDEGGSGVFYYVVAALGTADGHLGSHGFLLGDRIAPQTINIDEGKTTSGTNRKNVIVVNYAERKQDEPFTTAPSIGKSLWLKLDLTTMQFAEVEQNFEGESR